MNKYCPFCSNEVDDKGFCPFCLRYVDPVERSEPMSVNKELPKNDYSNDNHMLYPKYSISPIPMENKNNVRTVMINSYETESKQRKNSSAINLKIIALIVILFALLSISGFIDYAMREKANKKAATKDVDKTYGNNYIHFSLNDLDDFIRNENVIINPKYFCEENKENVNGIVVNYSVRTYYNNMDKLYILSEKKYDGFCFIEICSFDKEHAREMAKMIMCECNIYLEGDAQLELIKSEIEKADFSNKQVKLKDNHYFETYSNDKDNYFTVYIQ